jgi:subtilase family serine protease
MNRVLAVLILVVLAGCSAGTTRAVPAVASARGASDTATGLPADTATGLPAASFPCSPVSQIAQARCTLAININLPPLTDPLTLVSLIPGWHPSDLQSAYGLPSDAAGGTVAIVDAYDAPLAESDLATYRSTFGLPPCTSANGYFRKLNERGQAGPYPLASLQWAQETALDLEMVSAACPHCSIVLVEADSASIDDLGASVDTAAELGAVAVSNSYEAPEWAGELDEDVHYQHPGIAITASAGDLGKPSYPAASQWVTAVGGTSLVRSLGWSETRWTYSGGGCSAYVSRPSWQPPACATRAAADVAAVADPQTGVAMFAASAGGWVVAGGTSVGSPLVAAAYALSGTPAGPSFSYAHQSAFHDLAPGGYDARTGLGSPAGVGGL